MKRNGFGKFFSIALVIYLVLYCLFALYSIFFVAYNLCSNNFRTVRNIFLFFKSYPVSSLESIGGYVHSVCHPIIGIIAVIFMMISFKKNNHKFIYMLFPILFFLHQISNSFIMFIYHIIELFKGFTGIPSTFRFLREPSSIGIMFLLLFIFAIAKAKFLTKKPVKVTLAVLICLPLAVALSANLIFFGLDMWQKITALFYGAFFFIPDIFYDIFYSLDNMVKFIIWTLFSFTILFPNMFYINDMRECSSENVSVTD